VHGQDLSPVLADPTASVRDTYYAHTMDSPTQSVMVTDGHWKYIYSECGGIEELYDHDNDPCELRNLANEPAYRTRAEQMMVRIWEIIRDTGDNTLWNSQYPSLRIASPGPEAVTTDP